MVKMKTSYLFCIIFFYLVICINGCNIRDPSRFTGQFYFYKENKIISDPFPSEEFEKMTGVLKAITAKYGFIEDKEVPDDPTFSLDKKNIPDSHLNHLEGSDSFITIAITNQKNYVNITITDWRYGIETAFMKKLKGEIVDNFKKDFGIDDMVFKEVGVFLFNN